MVFKSCMESMHVPLWNPLILLFYQPSRGVGFGPSVSLLSHQKQQRRYYTSLSLLGSTPNFGIGQDTWSWQHFLDPSLLYIKIRDPQGESSLVWVVPFLSLRENPSWSSSYFAFFSSLTLVPTSGIGAIVSILGDIWLGVPVILVACIPSIIPKGRAMLRPPPNPGTPWCWDWSGVMNSFK